MAEIASEVPHCGGLYYWSSKMGGASGAGHGLFNLIGQDRDHGRHSDYGAAVFTDALLQLLAGRSRARPRVIYVYAVILALHALMNIFSVPARRVLNDISVWWHCLGVLDHRRVLVFKPTTISSFGPSSARRSTTAGFATVGCGSCSCSVSCRAQYTYTRLDASAHHERGDPRRVARRLRAG